MNNNIFFYCLGAAHFDIKAYAYMKPTLGESIPVVSSRCLGGVASNIAINLARQRAQVGLYSLLGNDAYALEIIKILNNNHINTQEIDFLKYSKTAQYYALLTPQGELFVAMADMDIYDEFSATRLVELMSKHKDISYWIIDANIPALAIKALAEHKSSNQLLWGVGVSTSKAKNLSLTFPHWYGLILNQDELYALTQNKNLETALGDLIGQGCSYAVVTAGSNGVYYSDGQKIYYQAALKTPVVDVSGAGDAFSAGLIYALAQGRALEEAVIFAMSLAAHILSCKYSSPVLS